MLERYFYKISENDTIKKEEKAIRKGWEGQREKHQVWSVGGDAPNSTKTKTKGWVSNWNQRKGNRWKQPKEGRMVSLNRVEVKHCVKKTVINRPHLGMGPTPLIPNFFFLFFPLPSNLNNVCCRLLSLSQLSIYLQLLFLFSSKYPS